MSQKNLIIKGAREHNLKNVDLTVPRDKFVVFTGISGSGKSSLAFDTIYAEGQRRYVESLSSYARQFLGQMEKPDVDYIEGLSPAISIDQKTTSKNPRSTVGTITEIYDYFRLLYARVGVPHCTVCGREIKQQTVDQIVEKVLSLEEGCKIQLLAPIVRGRKGEYVKELENVRKSGFVRVRIDSVIYDLSETANEIKWSQEKNIMMQVVVIKKENLYKYPFPNEYISTYWIKDYDDFGNERELVSIEKNNDLWMLISNEKCKIIDDNIEVDSVALTLNKFYLLLSI